MILIWLQEKQIGALNGNRKREKGTEKKAPPSQLRRRRLLSVASYILAKKKIKIQKTFRLVSGVCDFSHMRNGDVLWILSINLNSEDSVSIARDAFEDVRRCDCL